LGFYPVSCNIKISIKNSTEQVGNKRLFPLIGVGQRDQTTLFSQKLIRKQKKLTQTHLPSTQFMTLYGVKETVVQRFATTKRFLF